MIENADKIAALLELKTRIQNSLFANVTRQDEYEAGVCDTLDFVYRLIDGAVQSYMNNTSKIGH